MMTNLKKRLQHAKTAVVSGAVLVSGSALADPVVLDVSEATSAISSGVVAAGTIGVAWLAFKIIKRVWSRL